MITMTRHEFRQLLDETARSTLAAPGRATVTRRTRVFAAIAAGIAVAAVASLLAVILSGGHETSTGRIPPGNETVKLTLDDITQATGLRFKPVPATSSPPNVSEHDALAAVSGAYSDGLVLAGFEHRSGSGLTTTWIEAWVIVTADRQITEYPNRYIPATPEPPHTATARDVFIVSASDGTILRSYTL
jgi:hypothetical protein